jgi:hypothetical protein
MRFIGQVALDPRLFGSIPATMGYLFITDEDDQFVDGTYEPDGGENALVLQPGTFGGPSLNIAEGPTLYRMAERPGSDRLVRELCEFAVTLAYGEEARAEGAGGQDDSKGFENKVAGEPRFLQGEEYPQGGPWLLMLQLDSTSVPFYINFGDAGVGYAFIS